MVGDMESRVRSGTGGCDDDLPGVETAQVRLEQAVRIGAPGNGRAERPELGRAPRPAWHEEARNDRAIERDGPVGQAGQDREGGGLGVAGQGQGYAREVRAKGRESREG
jgi:hypothetical protein